MRIGTGGVLLPYYSAFRTAETFRMLEALYPGRIDLGIGRAPGGDQRTALAVGGGRFPDADALSRSRCAELAGAAGRNAAAEVTVRLQPEVDTVPAGLAARLLRLQRRARRRARPAVRLRALHQSARRRRGGARLPRELQGRRTSQPRVIVCTFAICAESDDEAERLAASIDLRRLHMALNIDSPVPTAEEAARHRYSDEERRYVAGAARPRGDRRARRRPSASSRRWSSATAPTS